MAPCSVRVLVLIAAALPCLGRSEAEGLPADRPGHAARGASQEAVLVDTDGGLHRLEKKVHAHHRHEGAQGHEPAQRAALLRREVPTNLTEVPLPLGIKGEQGDQGAVGVQGPKGAVGERGPQGDAGPAGATGPRGYSGRDGKNGAAASKPVAVDCVWEDWTVFSACDKTCGKHSRKRRDRNVLVFPQSGGKNCDGGAFQFVACDDVDCPVVLVNASANATANKSMANATVNLSVTHASHKLKKATKKAIEPAKPKKKMVVVTALPKKKAKKKVVVEEEDGDDEGSL